MSDACSFPQEAERGTTEPATRRDAVLLIEDNVDIAEMLTTVLRRQGLRVVWSQLGAEALATFGRSQREIALVLADCRLPNMDGREVCRQLRTWAPSLPMLLTSGNAGTPDSGRWPERDW